MRTLQYYWANGGLTVFEKYTIDENSMVTNIKTGRVATRHKNANGYCIINVSNERRQCSILVGRALASTFLGPPPTKHHTADHKDQNSANDTLNNIQWLDKSGQAKNRTRPSEYKSAFVIENGGVENTVKEWVEVLKDETTPSGRKYTRDVIQYYAQRQRYGFRYKTFSNLPREVWKVVKGSENKQGRWLISSKSRMKYATKYAENVLTASQLTKSDGYPVVQINGKRWNCHELAFKAFRPNEYAARVPGDVILHKTDDKLDFSPFRLRLGSSSDNRSDAYINGKYDGTKTAQKPIASYIDCVLEQAHVSINDAARYLQKKWDSSKIFSSAVGRAAEKGYIEYGRTWKFI